MFAVRYSNLFTKHQIINSFYILNTHSQDGKYISCEEAFENEYNDEQESSNDDGNANGEQGAAADVSSEGGEAQKIDNIKSILESGGTPSESEIEELLQYITGLKSTAKFLEQEAKDLEQKLFMGPQSKLN